MPDGEMGFRPRPKRRGVRELARPLVVVCPACDRVMQYERIVLNWATGGRFVCPGCEVTLGVDEGERIELLRRADLIEHSQQALRNEVLIPGPCNARPEYGELLPDRGRLAGLLKVGDRDDEDEFIDALVEEVDTAGARASEEPLLDEIAGVLGLDGYGGGLRVSRRARREAKVILEAIKRAMVEGLRRDGEVGLGPLGRLVVVKSRTMHRVPTARGVRSRPGAETREVEFRVGSGLRELLLDG